MNKSPCDILPLMKPTGTIYDAALEGEVERAEALLKLNPDLVLSREWAGNTPLHLASNWGHTEAAKLLLAYGGADVNSKGCNDRTPLHEAAVYGRTETAELLIENNAEVKYQGRYWLHAFAFGGSGRT